MSSSYKHLLQISKPVAVLGSIQNLLDWDQETYMPKQAIHFRSEQIELLASLQHKARTSKKMQRAIGALIDLESGQIRDMQLTQEERAAAREYRRDYLQAKKLPNAFVKQFAKTSAKASHAWQIAKEHHDFKSFAPHLEKIVKLSQKKAAFLGFKEHPYDALLDLYEPGLTVAFLNPLLTRLKVGLTHLIEEIALKPPVKENFLYHFCAKQKQLDFAHLLLSKMGFSPETSRLDTTAHPFCNPIHLTDIRMTTKIHPENLLFNIGAVLHEGGHGLYHQHLPTAHYGSPLAEAASYGIDESQSRWWEVLIGQSLPFWEHIFPLLQKEFPEAFSNISLKEFYRAINAIKPGCIRIEADEISYNLHVIVRFEIEKGLIEGSIDVKEVPFLWKEKMRAYLGIEPLLDGQGCLQDIHWSLGCFGYFPSYTLGNLYAAQFFNAFKTQHQDWDERVRAGDFAFINQFLKENIHQYGRQYSPQELCQKVTGKELSEKAFLDYLKMKYDDLYS